MRILKLLLTFSIIFTSLQEAAQGANLVWARQFGGNLNDNCSSACDQSGNVYRLQGGIAKHNTGGNPVWTVTTAFTPQSISFDAAGDLYVTGYFNTIADLDHGPGTFTVAPVGGWDIAIVKISSSGNFIWGGSMGSTGNDYGAMIFADPSGNTYIGGTLTGVYDVDPGAGTLNFTATGTDFFMSKLNTNGSMMWAKQFAGNSMAWIGSIDVDLLGDIYFCGYFSGTVDFDPGVAVSNLSTSSSSDDDMYIGKLDASGNFLWAKQMGATGSDYLYDLEIGSNGNLYCSGVFTGFVDFDSGPGMLALNSGTMANAFIAEFNSSGTPNWARNFSGFYVTAMALDQNNGICFTGQFRDADFDPGLGTYSITAYGSSWPDIYIAKLNAAGNLIWAKHVGSINDDEPTSISVDGSNHVHVAGRFKTSCNFNLNGGSHVLTAAGGNLNYDAFMMKVCQTPDPPLISGSTSLCFGQSAIYSVTPMPDAQSYHWTLPPGWIGTGQSGIPSTNSIVISISGSIVAIPVNSGTITATAMNNLCGYSPTVTLQVTVDLCPNTQKHSISAQTLYPNPSNGVVYLEISENYQVNVFNSLGQIIHACNVTPGKNILDLNGFTTGIYFIQLSRNEETTILKLILQ